MRSFLPFDAYPQNCSILHYVVQGGYLTFAVSATNGMDAFYHLFGRSV